MPEVETDDRITVGQLKSWLSNFPDKAPIYYDMDCFHGKVELRVELPATELPPLPLISTISL